MPDLVRRIQKIGARGGAERQRLQALAWLFLVRAIRFGDLGAGIGQRVFQRVEADDMDPELPLEAFDRDPKHGIAADQDWARAALFDPAFGLVKELHPDQDVAE